MRAPTYSSAICSAWRADADERGRGERLPFVQRTIERRACRVTRREHGARAGGRTIGEGLRRVVAGTALRRSGLDRDQLVAVEADGEPGHGSAGHQPPHAVDRGAQCERRDRLAVGHVGAALVEPRRSRAATW